MIRIILKGFAGLMVLLVLTACVQIVRNSGSVPVPPKPPEALRLATLNVHYIILNKATGAWSVADWERRKVPLDLAFKAVDADVMAFQEMESFGGSNVSDVNLTLDWLLAQNADFAAAAVGDPQVFPSTQPILYRKSAVEMVDQGWFFFSDTPDVIYSRTFNGSFPAFASWATFQRPDGSTFRVVNVHYEFSSRSNRLLSAALVRDRIRPWIEAGELVFVVGDQNARLGNDTLETLSPLGLSYAPVEGATYHLNMGLNLFGAIDHLAYPQGVTLAGPPVVLREKFAGEWPTDHYPVFADFLLP